jgi:DNA invertase Pin-like site-specific DNA recombinase
MKAIGYVRWSSDDQTAGNSLERQTENLKTYCSRAGLDLSSTLIDDGYSAFKGHHISRGKLGLFLTEADSGKHRGRALVVEQMDRLSRQGIDETWMLTRRLIAAGVEIHVTQKGRIIRSMDDLPTVILHVVESHSANEFSQKLRERVGAAWQSKKHDGPDGVSITRKLPGWLEGEVGEQIRVNAEKAKVVQRIFEMTAGGMGARMIARTFNEEGVPAFGGGKTKGKTEAWIKSYIQKILTNRAVLGEFQPRKYRKPDGDVRLGFFPAVIDYSLWEKARAAMGARKTSYGNGKGGRTGKISNLFTGLVWDISSEKPLPMNYQDKGNRAVPKLATSTSIVAQRHSLRYADFEKTFLRFLDQLDWTEVLNVTESNELLQAEEEVGRLSLEIERSTAAIDTLLDALQVTSSSKAIATRIHATEQKLEADKIMLKSAQERLASLRQRNHDLLDDSVVWSQLARARDLTTRARLREEIRRKVAKIDFQFSEDPSGKKVPVGRIQFVNGAVKYIAFSGGKIFAMSLKSEAGLQGS